MRTKSSIVISELEYLLGLFCYIFSQFFVLFNLAFENIVEGGVECSKLKPLHTLGGYLHPQVGNFFILVHNLLFQNALSAILDYFQLLKLVDVVVDETLFVINNFVYLDILQVIRMDEAIELISHECYFFLLTIKHFLELV